MRLKSRKRVEAKLLNWYLREAGKSKMRISHIYEYLMNYGNTELTLWGFGVLGFWGFWGQYAECTDFSG